MWGMTLDDAAGYKPAPMADFSNTRDPSLHRLHAMTLRGPGATTDNLLVFHVRGIIVNGHHVNALLKYLDFTDPLEWRRGGNKGFENYWKVYAKTQSIARNANPLGLDDDPYTVEQVLCDTIALGPEKFLEGTVSKLVDEPITPTEKGIIDSSLSKAVMARGMEMQLGLDTWETDVVLEVMSGGEGPQAQTKENSLSKREAKSLMHELRGERKRILGMIRAWRRSGKVFRSRATGDENPCE